MFHTITNYYNFKNNILAYANILFLNEPKTCNYE